MNRYSILTGVVLIPSVIVAAITIIGLALGALAVLV